MVASSSFASGDLADGARSCGEITPQFIADRTGFERRTGRHAVGAEAGADVGQRTQ
jgi:hypothetical protein